MNLKAFLRGITLILTSNPLDTLRLWSKGEGEEAIAIRYSLYIVNFIGANLGIIILILSAYIWFFSIVPNNCNMRVYNPFNITFNNATFNIS